MSSYRMEETINKLYEFIENCKPSTFSQSRIIVPKDHLLDLVDELKANLPDELKRYQKVISNRDNILALAEERAREIEAEAREKAQVLVNETEIMQNAYKQANDLIQSASARAEEIKVTSEEQAANLRSGILNYCEDVLGTVEEIYTTAYRSTKDQSEKLLATMKENLAVLENNHKELTEQINVEANGGEVVTEEEYSEEDLNDAE